MKELIKDESKSLKEELDEYNEAIRERETSENYFVISRNIRVIGAMVILEMALLTSLTTLVLRATLLDRIS